MAQKAQPTKRKRLSEIPFLQDSYFYLPSQQCCLYKQLKTKEKTHTSHKEKVNLVKRDLRPTFNP